MQRPPRPTGVTILAILEFLIGIIFLLGGVGLIFGSAIIGFLGAGIASGFLTVLGAGFFIFGLLAFLVGWGMWSGREWAWIVGLILAILGLLGGVSQMAVGNFGSIVGVLIDLIILYYLTRPHVRAYFKGGHMGAAPMAQPAPMTT